MERLPSVHELHDAKSAEEKRAISREDRKLSYLNKLNAMYGSTLLAASAPVEGKLLKRREISPKAKKALHAYRERHGRLPPSGDEIIERWKDAKRNQEARQKAIKGIVKQMTDDEYTRYRRNQQAAKQLREKAKLLSLPTVQARQEYLKIKAERLAKKGTIAAKKYDAKLADEGKTRKRNYHARSGVPRRGPVRDIRVEPVPRETTHYRPTGPSVDLYDLGSPIGFGDAEWEARYQLDPNARVLLSEREKYSTKAGKGFIHLFD